MDRRNESNLVCSGFCCTKMESLSVTFGNTIILDNINLHVHCGEFTAIIGPNGAGKSTLIKAILGEVKFDGSMSFVNSSGYRQVKPRIGYVPQNLNVDPSSPTSVLDFYIACRSKIPVWLPPTSKLINKAKECMKLAKADHLLEKRLGSLSGGELQRVLLALALDPVPELLLLDEPVSGMDQNGMDLFYQMLSELRSEYDLAIILVSHDFNLVGRHADRMVLLNKTVLTSGTPAQVFESDAFKKQFLPWSEIEGGSL